MIATLARALLSRDFFLYIPPRYRNNTKVYFLSLSLLSVFPSLRGELLHNSVAASRTIIPDIEDG